MSSDWTCEKCGLTLRSVTLPVRHNCVSRRTKKVVGGRPSSGLRYITTVQLAADTLALAEHIERPDAIVGITRSGMIPASILAAHLGADLWSVDYRTAIITSLGHGNRHREQGTRKRVVLIDDSVWSGLAMRSATRQIEEAWGITPLRLAVYIRPQAIREVDHFATAHNEHLFEWNVYNAPFANVLAYDLDGVMCRDFSRDEDDDAERYIAALQEMRPTHRRPRKPVSIITARLERYRRETEAWLARHGIAVERLIMGPWPSKAEREASDVGRWKHEQLRALGVSWYVESDCRQAAAIAKLGGLSVIATEDGSVHVAPPPQLDPSGCIHRGDIIERIVCRGCGASKEVDVYECGVHGRCHQVPANDHRAGMSCRACALADEGFEAP